MKGIHFVMMALCCTLTLFQSCTNTPSIVQSNPGADLRYLPGGYRYEFTGGSQGIIYQAPIREPIYEYVSCDSIIGHRTYESMSKFMKEYSIESVIISDDGDIYVFQMSLNMTPNDFDAFVFFQNDTLTDDQVIDRVNMLLPQSMPVTQSQAHKGNWLRITSFQDRSKDYMGLFDF